MKLEERIALQLGDLLMKNISLQVEIEKLREKLDRVQKDSEGAKSED